jgi:acetolactate decarboxylase
MKNTIYILAISLVFLQSCQEKKTASVEGVASAGALHEIMSGNLQANKSLEDLKGIPNLYALGAVEGLKGEVQIIDSKAYVSRVSPQQMEIDTTFSANAAMVVYAQVPEWKEISIPKAILTMKQFDSFLYHTAAKEGLDNSKPFPFMIEGHVRKIDWHVVDWDQNSNIEHTHENHRLTGLMGVTVQEKATILGFYSQNHSGVYVPHDVNWHMHFVAENERVAAHIDDLLLGEYMTLKLPKQF